MTTSVFKVHGLDCAEEVALLRAELTPLPGVAELSFDVLRGKMTVVHVPATATAGQLVEAVARAGLSAEPWSDRKSVAAPTSRWGDHRTLATLASGALLAGAFLTHAAMSNLATAFHAAEAPRVVQALYTLAAIAGAWFILPKAWRALVRLRPDMNLLMVVAVSGAILLGEFQEAATVSFLFALSLALEAWSVGRARRAIESLMALTPQQATVIRGNQESPLPAEQVAIGSTVLVRPGEKIPLDGAIVQGATSIDQSPITGESTPVDKAIGDEVFAGTINLDGAIHLRTTKLAEDTTLARIVRLVGDAQSKRSPSEQWVERFALVYTPSVMAAALAIMLLPPLFAGGVWSEWFYRGLVLLVIACPCALVISTPVSIVAAIASAARRGVLVKGGPAMEAPARLRAIAFDKTGTLTEGHPEVADVIALSGHSREELLRIAGAIEAHATHPLGTAIVRAARSAGIEPVAAADYRAIPGKGATATLDGREVWIGSYRLLEERGHGAETLREQSSSLSQRGMSLVAVGEDRHVCGFIGLADRARSTAKSTVAELHALGVRPLVMLTGDHRAAAEGIARDVGVDEIRAELLPENKVALIEELVAKHGAVAMIGDGVNDAPALARSTLGIAMGAAGTDAALETADVALMGDDLTAIPWLIRHSRRTIAIIRQNIYAALGVKLLFVLLSLAGYATLWTAIAADTGMSLAVVLNGLRLLRAK
jgi:Cd2+/Zn2+-exporting ATPase